MEQVNGRLAKVFARFRDFLDMLDIAARACRVLVHRRADGLWAGLHLDREKYIVGIDFDRPEILRFENNHITDEAAVEGRLGTGAGEPTKQGTGCGWFGNSR